MKNTTTKFMTDAAGTQVPVAYVSKYDKTRDKVARRILARYQKARAVLEQTLAETLADIGVMLDVRQEHTGKNIAEKGNFTFTSFDGLVKVELDQKYDVRMDDRVRDAREIMLDYAKSLVGDIDAKRGADLSKIIDAAFAASRTGNLSYTKINDLCKLDIHNAQWLKAREILTLCLQRVKGKRYVQVSVKASSDHDFETVKLDIADCRKEEVAK